MLSKQYIVVTVIVTVIVIALLVGRKIMARFRRFRRNRTVRASMRTVDPTETVRVLLYSLSADKLVRVVRTLFATAACPYRVFVGGCLIVDGSAPPGGDLWSRYRQVTRGDDDDHSNHVVFHDTALPRNPALHTLETSLHNNEKYMLYSDCTSDFSPDWDTILISALMDCPGRDPVLTGTPECDFLVVGLDSVVPRVLPVTDSVHKAIAQKQDHSNSNTPLRSTVLYHGFAFGESRIFQTILHDPFLGNVMADIIMSARYWTHGVDFFILTRPVAKRSRSTVPEFPNTPSESYRQRAEVVLALRPEESVHRHVLQRLDEFGMGEMRLLRNFERFAGIRFQNSVVSGRARMGLLPSLGTQEIVAKYGTLRNYEGGKKLYF